MMKERKRPLITRVLRPEEFLVLVFGLLLLTMRNAVGMPLTTPKGLLLRVIALVCAIGVSIMIPWLLYLGKRLFSPVTEPIDPLSFYRRIPLFVRDFLPYIVILAFYLEAFSIAGETVTGMIHPNELDYFLASFDEMLFGTQPSMLLHPITHPSLSDLMSALYGIHFLFIIALAVTLHFKRRIFEFRTFVLGITLIACIGFLGYLYVPSVSPVYRFHYTFDLRGGIMSDTLTEIMGMIHYAEQDCCVFPSLHVGLSTAVLLFAYIYEKKIFYLLAPFIILSWFSTIYLRRHYFIDILGGWTLAVLCVYISPKINRWWYGWGK